jgi:hypothetical protein
VKKIVLAAGCGLTRGRLVCAYALSPQVRAFVGCDAPAVRRTRIRVIGGTGLALAEDQTMVRADGKIAAIADRAWAHVPQDAPVRIRIMDTHEYPVIAARVGMHDHLNYPVFNRAIGDDSREPAGSAGGTAGRR